MQAQIQDLTAQLVASQQQCADLQAAATAVASSKDLVTPARLNQLGPMQQQVSLSEAAEANKSQRAQQHLRTGDEAARASQGSNASWRDALGLDSDSDADQAPAGQLANTVGAAGPSDIGPAWMQKPMGAGDVCSASDLAHHQALGRSEGADNAPAGLQLAVTSSHMHQQAQRSQQPLNSGALVAMPEQGAEPSASGQEVGWPRSSGPMQHAVRTSTLCPSMCIEALRSGDVNVYFSCSTPGFNMRILEAEGAAGQCLSNIRQQELCPGVPQDKNPAEGRHRLLCMPHEAGWARRSGRSKSVPNGCM